MGDQCAQEGIGFVSSDFSYTLYTLAVFSLRVEIPADKPIFLP